MIEVTIGELIKKKRKSLGLTQAKTCEGICEPETFSRIENNKQTPSRSMLNALLQRLDISDDRFYAAITLEEVEINKLCKEITAYNVKYEQTTGNEKNRIRNALIEKHRQLRSIIEGDDNISEQFIVRSEILIGEFDPEEKITKLVTAMRLTHPSFELSSIKKGIYSFDEIKIINQIAVAYSDLGKSEDAIKIWEDLLKNQNDRYENIVPSKTQKDLILYGLSRELLIEGKYNETKHYAEEGRLLSISYGIYQHLPGFLIILAECEYQLGNKDISKELFDDAYHLCKVIGDDVNKKIVHDAQTEYFSDKS